MQEKHEKLPKIAAKSCQKIDKKTGREWGWPPPPPVGEIPPFFFFFFFEGLPYMVKLENVFWKIKISLLGEFTWLCPLQNSRRRHCSCSEAAVSFWSWVAASVCPCEWCISCCRTSQPLRPTWGPLLTWSCPWPGPGPPSPHCSTLGSRSE